MRTKSKFWKPYRERIEASMAARTKKGRVQDPAL
jgi:hypothetical protein